MILTVTLNPALDITYSVPALVPGAVHRVAEVSVRAGGKGLNVARVLRILDVPVRATGLLGGDNGAQITALLEADGVASSFVPVADETRRTVVVSDGTEATGFWEPGPYVSAEEWRSFLGHYRDAVADATTVVLSGSLPRGLAVDAYAELIAIARQQGAEALLDTDGPALLAGLDAQPLLIKPNAAELAEATGRTVDDVVDAHAAAKAIRAGRRTAVVVSLGGQGLVASTSDGDWVAALRRPLTGNPTGAGDACVAALSVGIRNLAGWPDVLADAVACGAAAVLAPVAGVVDQGRVSLLRSDVTVKEM